MRRWLTFLGALFLIALMALAGYLSGPILARTQLAVRRARLPWERSMRPRAGETKEERALRYTRQSRAEVMAESRRVVRRFREGGLVFGGWCGLVVVFGIGAARSKRRSPEYEVRCGPCVACARCFLYCPRERLRLREDEEK